MPTYNIVSEGADNTGGTAIDSVLDGLVGDNTTIVFDSGTYLLNSLSVPSGVANFELLAPTGATLRPGSGDPWIDVAGPGFRWHNFEIDNTGLSHPGGVRVLANNWELTRLITRGYTRSNTDGQSPGNSSPARTWFRVEVPSSGATGLMEDCYFHDGSGEDLSLSNRRAVLVEQGSGDITFNRCWFESWGENTIYAQQPAGKVNIYSCYARNTQNPYRVGGNTTVRNCVSIRDGPGPYQGWSNSALQTGVRIEAEDAGQAAMDGWSGTLEVLDSDFYHRYDATGTEEDPTGACIGGSRPTQRIDVQRCRLSYLADRNQDCLYTGSTTTNEYLQLQDVHIRNDASRFDAISIGQTPSTWGTLTGVVGGQYPSTVGLPATHGFSIGTGTSPTAPNTTAPLPSPPGSGVPMATAEFVVIDNTAGATSDSYTITATTAAYPSGRDAALIDMTWGQNNLPTRGDPIAEGTVAAGDVVAYYAVGGVSDITTTGDAAVTVDGQPYADDGGGGTTDPPPDATASTVYRREGSVWVESAVQAANADDTHTPRPTRYFDGTQWQTVYDPAVTAATVVDDFEDGDLAEYTTGGNAAYSVINNSTAAHGGSWYLDIDAASHSFGIATSTSGLPAYPAPGDTLSVFWYPEALPASPNPNAFRVYYGYVDADNFYYFAHIGDTADHVEFAVESGGTRSFHGTVDTSAPLTDAGWYETRIAWGTDGTHTATVFNPSGTEIASTSMANSAHTTGGIAYYADGQTHVRVDDYTLE